MNDILKVIFIGGLTNGRVVYDYLSKNKFVNLLLVITYPDNYSSVRHVIIGDGRGVVKSTSVVNSIPLIRKLNPDLIIVAGWSELIPNEILGIPQLGVIGFHPAKLPYNRGRSVLAWQIEEGYRKTALTMFRYTDYPDGGDILAQESIYIAHNDYINDVLDKIDSATLNLMRAYFPLLRKGLLKGARQDLSIGSFRRLRGSADSVIHWDRNSEDIYNKVRAISRPYPGATAEFGGKKMLIWKSDIIDSLPFHIDALPGTIVAECCDYTLLIRTRDSYLRITDYEWL